MADTNASIDQNFEKVSLAVDSSGFTKPLLVEPVFDYLEIDIAIISSHTDTALTIKEDENFEGVALAVDSNSVVKPLKVEASTGNLIIDVTFI